MIPKPYRPNCPHIWPQGRETKAGHQLIPVPLDALNHVRNLRSDPEILATSGTPHETGRDVSAVSVMKDQGWNLSDLQVQIVSFSAVVTYQ